MPMNAEATAFLESVIRVIEGTDNPPRGDRIIMAQRLFDFRKAMNADLTEMQQQIEAGADAVKSILDNWQSGDLAQAVNNAEAWRDDVMTVFPDFDWKDSEADDKAMLAAAGMDMVTAADLKEGDMVDLEGDPYANGEDTQHIAPFELFVVRGVERETADCVRVDFDNLSVGFPPNHRLRTHRIS